jgi:futalosine hydrolase
VILVVCALTQELAGFAPSKEITLLATGIGPAEAAAATARELALGSYDAVVSAGIAGVFPGCGNVGDARIIGEELFADFGREDQSPLRLPDGATLVRRVAAAETLVERARALPYAIVRGLTATRITTTNATALRLRQSYQADVESMESFAVLRAAELAAIPAIGVRGISNIVGDAATSGWNFNAGVQATVTALQALLERLSS